VIGVLYLPWLLVLFGQSANVHSRFWTIPPDLDTVWNVFRITLLCWQWDEPIVWSVANLIVSIVAVKTVVNFRDVKGLALGTSVVLPLLASYLSSIILFPIMAERTLLFVSIPLLALIGSFLKIPDAKAGTAIKIVGGLQIAVGVVLYAFLVYINLISWRIEQGVQSKDDFRGAASVTARFANEYTAVVFNNSASQAVFDYYFHRFDEGRKVDEYGVPCHYLEVPESNANLEPLVTPESIRALDKKLSAYQRVILVRNHDYYSDPSVLLKSYFDSQWRFDRDLSALGVEIFLYTRR
jgi:hypothetical protein